MGSLKKPDVLEHNLKTLDSFVRKEFSKLMKYTPTELWNTQSAILNEINKQKKELQNLKQFLDTRRKQTMESLSEFYKRLPEIKDIKILLTEFKSQNDSLVDYIQELEKGYNEVLGVQK